MLGGCTTKGRGMNASPGDTHCSSHTSGPLYSHLISLRQVLLSGLTEPHSSHSELIDQPPPAICICVTQGFPHFEWLLKKKSTEYFWHVKFKSY